MMSARPPSLIKGLMLAQMAPLALLAVFLAGVGAWTAHKVVEMTADRLLAGSVRAILQGVSAENSAIRVDLPSWALGLLDGPERDVVFYSVRQGDRLITGYDDIAPMPSAGTRQAVFEYADVRGVRVRVAAQSVRVPGFDPPVTVAVAHSLDSRRAVLWRLLFSLSLLPLLIVAVGAVLLWPAAYWGMRPVRRLTDSLAARSTLGAADFGPMSTKGAPVELWSVVEAFNRLLDSLGRSTTRVRQFSADASHQLRTPLTVITANLEIVLEGRRDWTASEKALMSDSVDASQRLEQLLTQLLSLARSGSAELGEGVDLGQVVSAAAAASATKHAIAAHAIVVRAPRSPLGVRGDRALLIEMFSNVLDNALLHSGVSRVFVVVRSGSAGVSVTIWDRGHGVSEGELPHLFDRHFRGQGSGGEGSGLGLAIVKALADSHGVVVEAFNRPRRQGLVIVFQFAFGLDSPARGPPC